MAYGGYGSYGSHEHTHNHPTNGTIASQSHSNVTTAVTTHHWSFSLGIILITIGSSCMAAWVCKKIHKLSRDRAVTPRATKTLPQETSIPLTTIIIHPNNDISEAKVAFDESLVGFFYRWRSMTRTGIRVKNLKTRVLFGRWRTSLE